MSAPPEFPAPDYTDLFGITRADLEELGEAERQADDGRRSLRDWRHTYDSVLARYPDAADAIAASRDEWTQQCTAIWFDRDPDDLPPAWADLAEDERKDRARSLIADLSALRRPPADEDLHRMFADVDAHEQVARGKRQAEMVDLYVEQKQVISRWIAETDGVPRDPWSGLPRDRIEPHRWVEDDVLGRVPVAFRAAMAQTWLAADADERKLAGSLANGPDRSETDWKATHAFAALAGTALSEFLRWLAESPDPSAAAVIHEWRHGNLPQLVQEYLDQRG